MRAGIQLAAAGIGLLLWAAPLAAQPIQSAPLSPVPQGSPTHTLPAVPPPSAAQPPAPETAPAPRAAPPVAPVEPDWLPQGGVVLIGIDKITARSEKLTGKVGETLHFGTLTIVARKCVVRPPDQPAGAAAWLDISDTAHGADAAMAFHGWMFSQYPGLNPLQHPAYGILLAGCTP